MTSADFERVAYGLSAGAGLVVVTPLLALYLTLRDWRPTPGSRNRP
jgi:hypothetical protein